MSFRNPMSDGSMFNLSQSVNPMTSSTFYTSGSKEALFNFMGTAGNSLVPPTVVNRSAFHIGPREKRKSESSDLTVSYDEEAPPRKLYVSEAAMSNHFAQMNLTHSWKSPNSRSSEPYNSALNAFADLAADIDLNSDAEKSQELASDTEESTREKTEPLLQLSNDLKKHLKNYSLEDPVEEVIREIVNPKPSLALVPFDPNLVPPTFREENSPKQDSAANESTKCDSPLIDSMDVEPVTPSPISGTPIPSADRNSFPSEITNYPSVDCATSFYPGSSKFVSQSTQYYFGSRNVFSYPVSNMNDYPFVPNTTQPLKTQGPTFPPV